MTRALACACVLLALDLAACAQVNTSTAVAKITTVQSATDGSGVILSIRAITAQNNRDAWRAGFLAYASATATSSDGVNNKLMEFIVLVDDGATISIVQNNELGLHPGDHVTILRGARTQLARPSGA